jgi:phosphonate transport system substrate-binding protein
MRFLLLTCLFCVFSFAQTLTLGVVPQQSPFKLSKKWTQVTQYLSQQMGIEIIFKTESSIPEFEKKLYAGAYDFAYMNPYHFVIAQQKQDYSAKVRANKKIVGILLSKDANLKISKENLKGKTFLYPAPNAFAATLLTKYELKEKYNLDIEKEAQVLNVNSHDSVY